MSLRRRERWYRLDLSSARPRISSSGPLGQAIYTYQSHRESFMQGCIRRATRTWWDHAAYLMSRSSTKQSTLIKLNGLEID